MRYTYYIMQRLSSATLVLFGLILLLQGAVLAYWKRQPPQTSMLLLEMISSLTSGRTINFISPDGVPIAEIAPAGMDVVSVQTWSPDGTWLYYIAAEHGDFFDLYRLNITQNRTEQVTHTPQESEEFAAWSPDGEWILVQKGTHERSNLFLMRPDGGSIRQITDGDGNKQFRLWSLDGRWIFYVTRFRNGSGGFQLNMVNLADDTQHKVPIDSLLDIPVVLSPDGAWIYYAFKEDEEHVLARTPIHSLPKIEPQRLYETSELMTLHGWSLDGEWLVFTESRAIRSAGQLYLISSEGGDVTPVDAAFGSTFSNIWTSDGASLIFRSLTGSNSLLFQYNTQTGALVKQYALHETESFHGFSPDGDWLIFSERSQRLFRASGWEGRKQLILDTDGRFQFYGWIPLFRTPPHPADRLMVFGAMILGIGAALWRLAKRRQVES